MRKRCLVLLLAAAFLAAPAAQAAGPAKDFEKAKGPSGQPAVNPKLKEFVDSTRKPGEPAKPQPLDELLQKKRAGQPLPGPATHVQQPPPKPQETGPAGFTPRDSRKETVVKTSTRPEDLKNKAVFVGKVNDGRKGAEAAKRPPSAAHESVLRDLGVKK